MPKPPIILWDQAYNRNGDPALPKVVINALRTYMDTWTLEGFVKAETLARVTGLSVRQVRRQIAANVEAGWIEITAKGHSGRKANDYRLTLPKGDMDVTISGPAKGVTDDTQRVTSMTAKGDMDVTPTSPRTSPRSSLSTSPEKGVMDDTIPTDPKSGSGHLPVEESTSKSKGDTDVTIDPFASAPVNREAEDIECKWVMHQGKRLSEKAAEDPWGMPSL